jgi:hypothetical protein
MFMGNCIMLISSVLTELETLELYYYFSPLLSYNNGNVARWL